MTPSPSKSARAQTPAPGPSPASSRLERVDNWLQRRAVRIGWVVFLGSFLLFASTRTLYNGGDVRAVTDLAWWVADSHLPRLNGHPAYPGNMNTFGYWAFRTPGGLVATKYHHGGPILFAAPLFAFLDWIGIRVPVIMEGMFAKLIASLMTALAAWCLWRVMAAHFGAATALLAAVLFSLGSPAYGVLSQGLFVQTGAILSQALSMVLVMNLLRRAKDRPDEPVNPVLFHAALALGGFFASWAAICRPTFAIWTLLVGIPVLLQLRRRSWSLFLGLAIGGLMGLMLLKVSTGRFFGEWGSGKPGEIGLMPQMSTILQAAAGFWISPARGLLVFCPWLVVFFAGIVLFIRRGAVRDPWFWVHFLFSVAIYGAVITFSQWYAGWSGGPRLQADLLLSALFLSGPALRAVARRASLLIVLAILLVPAAWIERSWAVINWDHSWEAYTRNLSADVWKLRDGQLHWYWSGGAIERSVRGETRDPLVDKPLIDPADPEVLKYVDSGITPNAEKKYFQLAARRATFALRFSDVFKDRDLLAVFEISDPSFYGFLRRIKVEFNGKRIGQVQFLSGERPREVVVLIPRTLHGRAPHDRLTLLDRDPPAFQYGASFPRLSPLTLLPADSPMGQEILAKQAGAGQKK